MWMPALLLATTALGTSNAVSEAETRFLTRAAALSIDEACDVFTQEERQALSAGLAQSRRDLADSPQGREAVERALGAVRADRGLARCGSAAVQRIAREARDAATEILRQPWMAFDGPARRWEADRTSYDFVRWPLLQPLSEGRFGLAVMEGRGDGRKTAPALVLEGRIAAASAVIVMRDPARIEQPYDVTLGGYYAVPDGLTLARFSAPAHGEKRIAASAALAPDLAARLATDRERVGDTVATGFRFPEGTLEAISMLDAHEAVAIELISPRGEVIKRVWVEAGHLAGARDFLALPYQKAAHAP